MEIYLSLFRMSYWSDFVGKIKIKPERRQDFYYLFEEEYDKIKDPVLKEFTDWFDEDEMYLSPLKEWGHRDEKSEWVGKYRSFYEGGVFSFGKSFSSHEIRAFELIDKA